MATGTLRPQRLLLYVCCISSFIYTVLASRPTFLEEPADVFIAVGNSTKLSCTADAGSISWYKDGVLLPKRTTSNIFLHKVLRSDFGSYVCNATNSDGSTISRTGSITEAKLETEFNIQPSRTAMPAGEVAVLECRPPAGIPKPEVTWLKDGVVIPKSTDRDSRIQYLPNDNLQLLPLQFEDSGAYVCRATNEAGVRDSAVARLTAEMPPKFTIGPDKFIKVNAGETVRLPCKASGSPAPITNWARADQRAFSRGTQNYGDALEIKNVDVSAAGVYICTARSGAKTIQLNSTVEVLADPDFVEKPTDVTASVGKRLELRCKISGWPKPEISWQVVAADGRKLEIPAHARQGNKEVEGGGSLIVNPVQKTDEGTYTCIGRLGSKLVQHSAVVSVTARMQGSMPSIVIGPADRSAVMGAPVWFDCVVTATGVGEIVVSWMKNDVPISTHSQLRLIQYKNNSLSISDAEPADSGKYTCRASSSAGEVTKSATLEVSYDENSSPLIETPKPPSQPQVVSVGVTSVQLQWNPVELAKTYVIQAMAPSISSEWKNVKEVPQSEASNIVTVPDLVPNTRYVFKVVARNEAGRSADSLQSKAEVTKRREVAISREVAQKVLANPELLRIADIEVRSGGELKVNWVVHRDEDKLDNFLVEYREQKDSSRKWTSTMVESNQRVLLLRGLRPYTEYEVRVIVLAGGERGAPKYSSATTREAAPGGPPLLLAVTQVNQSAIQVTWEAPDEQLRNGLITTYRVGLCWCRYLDMPIEVNIVNRDNESSSNKFVFAGLSSKNHYCITVSASTRIGEGPVAHVTFAGFVIGTSVWRQPWFLPVLLSLVFVLFMTCLVLFICYLQRRRRRQRFLKNSLLAVPVSRADTISKPPGAQGNGFTYIQGAYPAGIYPAVFPSRTGSGGRGDQHTSLLQHYVPGAQYPAVSHHHSSQSASPANNSSGTNSSCCEHNELQRLTPPRRLTDIQPPPPLQAPPADWAPPTTPGRHRTPPRPITSYHSLRPVPPQETVPRPRVGASPTRELSPLMTSPHQQQNRRNGSGSSGCDVPSDHEYEYYAEEGELVVADLASQYLARLKQSQEQTDTLNQSSYDNGSDFSPYRQRHHSNSNGRPPPHQQPPRRDYPPPQPHHQHREHFAHLPIV